MEVSDHSYGKDSRLSSSNGLTSVLLGRSPSPVNPLARCTQIAKPCSSGSHDSATRCWLSKRRAATCERPKLQGSRRQVLWIS